MMFALLTLLLTDITKSSQCNVETVQQHRCPMWVPLNDSSPISATDGIKIELTTALNDIGAACLDGTVPVIYYRAAQDSSAKNKWHIFLEGGGACAGLTQNIGLCFDACEDRAGTDLGSSNDYPRTADFNYDYMSTDPAVNPLTYNWNTIYSKYCDGAMWSGDNSTLQPAGKYMLHYRGRRIIQGIFQELSQKYEFSSATDILLSGCSAGGVGVYAHTQYIYENFIAKNANFLAMSDSGFAPEYNGNGGLVDAIKWMYYNQNISATMDVQCLMDHPTSKWDCFFPPNYVQYISAPIFALQARFDQWQTDCILCTKDPVIINEYGQNFTDYFIDSLMKNGSYADNHGGFLDSCHHHCGEWNQMHVDGMDQSQVELQFYSKHATTDQHFWFQNRTYPCVSCCND